MPIRVATKTIILHREGANVSPPIGKAFNFTEQELKDINSVDPRAVRKPVNEGEEIEHIIPANTKPAAKGGKDKDVEL